ncbi:MAG: ABC transporter ATP-binding protein [Chloroflexi bacterium]|nr:ABC transporter ATP-binding protein [Chloroflexota bacterium]
MPPIIEMHGITKRFGGVIANDGVDFSVEPGEIHALLGENGAGKSTLMKILYGLYQPDAGEIRIGGQSVRLTSPAEAIASGIGFVSQHFALVPRFTVAENVILGREGTAILKPAAMTETVLKTAASLRLMIDVNAVVGRLSVGEQQRVEILKALYRDCKVLIMDEPTAVLAPGDIDALFDILRTLQSQGMSVIIITHKLNEVFDISQRVTVLRLGKVVGRAETKSTTPAELAQMMVGRQTVAVTRNVDHHRQDTVRLAVRGLRLTDKRGGLRLRGLNLDVRAGEIVGIAGVAGNGQSELVSVLTGMAAPDSGTVMVGSTPLPFRDPKAVSRLKIARIPEDRLKGVIGDLSVQDNLMLEQVESFTRLGHLDRARIRENAEALIRDFQIRASPTDMARTLSGGNIQKIILARSLGHAPEVVIAAQPTRGLDIGATEYVHQKLLEQKERGAAILLISEDLEEILLLSDRILVIYEGEIVGEQATEDANVEQIGALMTGAHHA